MMSSIIPKKKNLICGHYDYNFSKGRCKGCANIDSFKKRSALASDISKLRKETNNIDADIIEDKVRKEKWFRLIRTKLVGTCQCGCGNKSQKNDDMYFRSSCCHIFPKSKFSSVKYHPLNYVERAFWGGCHSVMDDTSMDRWVNMADFDDIKEKFYELAPLLTDEERASKFYTHLEKLIYEKNRDSN